MKKFLLRNMESHETLFPPSRIAVSYIQEKKTLCFPPLTDTQRDIWFGCVQERKAWLYVFVHCQITIYWTYIHNKISLCLLKCLYNSITELRSKGEKHCFCGLKITLLIQIAFSKHRSKVMFFAKFTGITYNSL